MRHTSPNGKEWRMYTTARDGTKVAKELNMVFEECGISTLVKEANWMRETLAEHADFRDEKSMIERMLVEHGHIPCFLPKFHPELNRLGTVEAFH